MGKKSLGSKQLGRIHINIDGETKHNLGLRALLEEAVQEGKAIF